jgi:nitrite reductase/ring-hydroxylating ferredoxin subunit
VLLLRRGAEVRVWRNLCPHQWLPLTYRSDRILSADGTRLRCSNHGAEFSAADGRPLDATLPCGLEAVPVRIDADGRVVLRPQA